MMENTTGWVCLHRKILDNPRFKGDWFALWSYLLLKAAHRTKKVVFNGQRIELQPGQLITGRLVLSEVLGIKEGRVRSIMNHLVEDQQIDQQTTNGGSLITILNWDRYQGMDQPNNQPTTSEQPANDQPTTSDQPLILVNNVTMEQGKQRNNKTVVAAVARPAITDVEWKEHLKGNIAYTGINIEVEYGKMTEWCRVNGKQPTRRRFINWLNKADKPMNATVASKPLTVMDVKNIRDTKQALADKLKNKFTYEDAFGLNWSDKAKLAEWKKLQAEIKDLNLKMSSFYEVKT